MTKGTGFEPIEEPPEVLAERAVAIAATIPSPAVFTHSVMKYVIVKVGERCFLLTDELIEETIHSAIVSRFLRRHKVPHYGLYGHTYEVMGGGCLRVSDGDKTIVVYGSSEDYGAPEDLGLLRSLLDSAILKELSGYTLLKITTDEDID